MRLQGSLRFANVLEHNSSRRQGEQVLRSLIFALNTHCACCQVSILLFYRRLFPTQRIRQITMGLFIFLAVWYAAFQLTAIFQCTPVHYYWNRTIPGHCVNDIDFYIALAATNTVTDVILLILPMPTVWALKVNRSKRLALSAVFLLGAFVCGIALYRISTLPLIDPSDITFSNTFAGVWTAIEGSVGVIVACLPSLMPIWRRLRGRAADYPYYSSQSNRYDGSQGLQTGAGRSRATRKGFDTITTATSPERNTSEERIIQNSTVVGHASDTDIRAAQGEITVVTEVQQDIELRRLP
jgi:hypothetical protein